MEKTSLLFSNILFLPNNTLSLLDLPSIGQCPQKDEFVSLFPLLRSNLSQRYRVFPPGHDVCWYCWWWIRERPIWVPLEVAVVCLSEVYGSLTLTVVILRAYYGSSFGSNITHYYFNHTMISCRFVEMHLLLGSLSWLHLTLYPVLLLLVVQPLLPFLQISPLSFLLSYISLDTEHQQHLLSKFIVEFNIFFSRRDLLRNIHSL